MSENSGMRSAFGDDSEAEDLLASFSPKPLKPSVDDKPSAVVEKAVEQVAEKRGFQKRAKPKKKAMRRSQFYKTGRSAAIAMKGREEDKVRINAICDKHDWVQGQLLEYALDALAEKIASPDDAFWTDHNFEGVD